MTMRHAPFFGRFGLCTRPHVFLVIALGPLTACATIRQDEIGVNTRFGRVATGPLQPGAQFVFPGVNSVLRVPSRVVNREVRLELPTREGLNVSAEVSILYRARPDQVARILEKSGVRYEDDVIIPVFRSAAADVSARFMAKDLHSGTRAGIESAIKTQMMTVLDARGFEQMRFVLDREKQEAERRTIEAAGIRDSWAIIAQGLTPAIISYQSIEAFRELARSSNAKVIITDGKTPMLLSADAVTDAAAARTMPFNGGASLSSPATPVPSPRRIERPASLTSPRSP